MTKCSCCSLDKQKDAFSKAQLRKPPSDRRCKQCVERGVTTANRSEGASRTASTSGSSASPATSNIERQIENIRLIDDVDLVGLVQRVTTEVLSPDRVHGVREELREPRVQEQYLMRLFVGSLPRMKFLVDPLTEGLLKGGRFINVSVSGVGKNDVFPLLMWVCQWKLLKKAFGWSGEDEIVSMVLAAGADVSATLRNGCNAAFFAVKYGSPRTLQLLIDAGINMEQKDKFNRTCLYNALERPSPEMLRIVLNHLPATETFENLHGGRGDAFVDIESAADRILSLFTIGEKISWKNIGPPMLDDLAECFVMVRQAGAKILSDCSLGSYMNLVQGDARLIRESPEMHRTLKRLVECALGLWLPPNIRKHITEQSGHIAKSESDGNSHQSSEGTCSICLNSLKKGVELYCGHSFCRSCILDHGQSKANNSCPVCRRPLCLEISPLDSVSQLNPLESMLGLKITGSRSYGLSHISDDHVIEEAKSQGLYSQRWFSLSESADSLRIKLNDAISKGHDARINKKVEGRFTGSDGRTCRLETPVTLELSATDTIVSDKIGYMAPCRGPVMIEIVIKGIPVLASISNNSIYTFVSKPLVETFNLKRVDTLSSNQFRTVSGKKFKNQCFTCLDEFAFSIGGANVMLRNAVEVSPKLGAAGEGIQLGMDFFMSAAFCVVDVKVAPSSFMRFDGQCSWVTSNLECDPSESLRYYSHDGKSAHVKLLHAKNMTGEARINIISLKEKAVFHVCSWCCRGFPKGMRVCSVCQEAGLKDAFYCDDACQTAAFRVHRFLRRDGPHKTSR